MNKRMPAVLVFDETVGTNSVCSHPQFNALLGMYDKYAFQVSAGPISSAGNLSVRLQHSSDELNWGNKNTNAEINNVALSTTQVSSLSGSDSGSTVGMGAGRLVLSCSAGNARVKVWAVGRDA